MLIALAVPVMVAAAFVRRGLESFAPSSILMTRVRTTARPNWGSLRGVSDGSGVGSGQGELDAVVLPENWWMALDGGVGVAVVVIVVKSCARVAPSPAGDVEGAPPSATIRSADGSTGQGETTTSTLRLANTPLPYPATGPR